MNKFLITAILLSTGVFADNFEQFLDKAIKNSPYLKSSALDIKQVKEDGDILLRYKNPTLEMEYSSFQPDLGSSKDGYRISYSQPIRLWSVGDDKKALAKANVKRADANYAQKRATFVRDISLLYNSYSRTKRMLKLGKEEFIIAKKIYDISLARFESGTISNGLKLQAQVDYEMVESLQERLSLLSMNSYFKLLRLAGINKEIKLEDSYNFSVKKSSQTIQNPTIELYQAGQNSALQEVKLNSNSIEWVDLFAELENEPEQDIYRVGVNIPLVIFNSKSQEKRVATLQATKVGLLIKNEKSRLNMELVRLQKEHKTLLKLDEKSKKTLKTQLRLLQMYQDGYKIANISLLQLQDIKNKLIQTRREIIEINTALNQNAIYTNYNQGNYNE